MLNVRPKYDRTPLHCIIIFQLSVLPLHPLAHRTVVGWRLLISTHVMNMLQSGHWDWSRFPSSRITIIYCPWGCLKCIQMLVWLVEPPQLSTWLGMQPNLPSVEMTPITSMGSLEAGYLTTESPSRFYAGCGSALPGTHPPGPLQIPGIWNYPYVWIYRMVPNLSYSSCKWPQSDRIPWKNLQLNLCRTPSKYYCIRIMSLKIFPIIIQKVIDVLWLMVYP